MKNYINILDLYTNKQGESILFGYIDHCRVTVVKIGYDEYTVCEAVEKDDYVFDMHMPTDALKLYLQQNKVYDEKDFNQFTKLTLQDFNKKYAPIIEPGFYGLAIDDIDVIDYLDRMFQSILQYEPDFMISQIKTKFGSVVIYADGIDEEGILELREGIAEILKSKN